MNIEENLKKLSFLVKKTDNTLGYQVYRKSTYTDRYMLSHIIISTKSQFTCTQSYLWQRTSTDRTQPSETSLTKKRTW